MPTPLAEIVSRLGRPRVLVVGDVMLDRYTFGIVERVSPEAPVPVLSATEQEERQGGAASVAAMLAAFEAEVILAGVIGDDAAGHDFRRLLDRSTIDARCVLVARDRLTTVKHRFIGRARDRHPQQLIRVDREVRSPLPTDLQAELLAGLEPHWDHCDIVLVSDYAKGVCTQQFLRRCIEQARARGIPLLIDPHPGGNYAAYAGGSCLTPNRAEASAASGLPIDAPEQALAAGEQMLSQLETQAIVITLDRDGMALVHRDGRRKTFPTRPRQVYDVTGAGDMVLSVLGLALTAGVDYEDALPLANLAAGLEVERLGVATLTRADLLSEIRSSHPIPAPQPGGRSKTPPLADLLAELERHRRSGQQIVFTNGCFDILHAGHVHSLQQARALGDFLVVGLNSDASVRRLKGENRPLHRWADRAAVLTAFECVDAIVPFEEDTPARLIAAVRPNILVKGGDYRIDQVVGREFVESVGGRVVLIPIREGLSSTRLLAPATET